jgi:antitoxin component of MazEF toxin-antitoxin module
MTKKLIRHGNSAAIVLDKALLELLNVKLDTPLEVTTDGRNIIISPNVASASESSMLDSLSRINERHGRVFKRLAK